MLIQHMQSTFSVSENSSSFFVEWSEHKINLKYLEFTDIIFILILSILCTQHNDKVSVVRNLKSTESYLMEGKYKWVSRFASSPLFIK